MNDPRFDSYHERRYTHLIKLAMVLCALRGYTCIDKADYQEAHRILEPPRRRSEEHTSELQSLMRISYAVFCLKKKTNHNMKNNLTTNNTRNPTSQTKQQ